MEQEIPTFEGDDLQERLKSWDKEKKGLISDLQKERGERHALEERLALIEQDLSSAGSTGEKPEDRLNALAADPDGYISAIVSEAVKPLEKHLSALVIEKKLDRARKFIAKKEGIDPGEVDDKLGEDLVRIGNERGLTSLDPEKGVRAAYDMLLQEREEKKAREAERERSISGLSSETVRVAGKTGAPRFTREAIVEMIRNGTYEKHREEILDAQRNGQIKM